MLPRLVAAPFATLPKARWNDNIEKKPRIPIEKLLESESDDDDDIDVSTELEADDFFNEETSAYSEVTKSITNLSYNNKSQTSNVNINTVNRNDISQENMIQEIPDTNKKSILMSIINMDFIKQILRNNDTYNDIQKWRSRKAQLRRNNTLIYYEEKVIRYNEEQKKKLEEEIMENRRCTFMYIQKIQSYKKNYIYTLDHFLQK
jgi:hypothetical protein